MLGRLGAIRLLERASAARAPVLMVLTYHRIAQASADRFYDPVISATPDAFRAQIEWLQNRFRLLTLDDLDRLIQNGRQWREPAALITFDDGYRDNFEVAAPILRELKAPATFFIPTGFLETPRLPWWDFVAYVIKQTRVKQLSLDRSERTDLSPISIDLESGSRRAAIAAIIGEFLRNAIADERWFLLHLASRAEVNVMNEDLSRELFMGWDDVKQLADADPFFSIGSHAHSHAQLAGLDDESQRRELAISRQILEGRLGRQVHAIAYPFGWEGTYNSVTKEVAKQTGYRQAFCSQLGVNRRSGLDTYAIRRLGVGSTDSPAMLRARSALLGAVGRSFL